jgi:hypothetical protein
MHRVQVTHVSPRSVPVPEPVHVIVIVIISMCYSDNSCNRLVRVHTCIHTFAQTCIDTQTHTHIPTYTLTYATFVLIFAPLHSLLRYPFRHFLFILLLIHFFS